MKLKPPGVLAGVVLPKLKPVAAVVLAGVEPNEKGVLVAVLGVANKPSAGLEAAVASPAPDPVEN